MIAGASVTIAHDTWGPCMLLHADQCDASVIVRVELASHVPVDVLAFALEELADLVRRARHARALDPELVGELIDLAAWRKGRR